MVKVMSVSNGKGPGTRQQFFSNTVVELLYIGKVPGSLGAMLDRVSVFPHQATEEEDLG